MAKEICDFSELLCNDTTKNKVRIVCISDTHNKAEDLMDKLPDGDILIHAGDFTLISSEREIHDFNNFLMKVSNKYKYIVVIAGNHDYSFDETKYNKSGFMRTLFKVYFGFSPLTGCPNPSQSKKIISNSCVYVQDEMIELLGIKIYGSPWQPSHFDLGFNLSKNEDLESVWRKIPNETDILITHGPPYSIGDRIKRGGKMVGCQELLKAVKERVKPRYHVFGHIHESYGVWKDDSTIYINSAMCNEHYTVSNQPICFDYIL